MKNSKKKSPIFYARTPKMVLMLSMQPTVTIYDTRCKLTVNKHLMSGEEKIETTETVLEALLKNNSECAKTLLSSGITKNNKDFNDRDLIFIYNMKMLAKEKTCNKVW
jgi:hypothetical protein